MSTDAALEDFPGAPRQSTWRFTMNKLIRCTLIATLALTAQAAFAHDPKEHEKEAAEQKAAPDCAAIKDMDMSKMDMNDPVMKAMHDKCMGQMNQQDPDMKDMDHSQMKDPKAPAQPEPHEVH